MNVVTPDSAVLWGMQPKIGVELAIDTLVVSEMLINMHYVSTPLAIIDTLVVSEMLMNMHYASAPVHGNPPPCTYPQITQGICLSNCGLCLHDKLNKRTTARGVMTCRYLLMDACMSYF